MGVYFEPRGRSWLDYVAPVVGDLLGGMINQGFEKNREIRAAKQVQEFADADFARKRQERAGALAFLQSPDQSFDVRGNPEAASRSFMGASLYGIPVPDILKTFGAPTSFQSVNAGDRVIYGSHDPVTGNFASQEAAFGINPTDKYTQDATTTRDKYAQDAATKRTQISEGGAIARNRANVGLGYSKLDHDKRKADLVQLADGTYAYADPYGRTVTPTGQTGPNPLGNKKSPNLRTIQLEDGTIALVNPETGEIAPTTYKGQQKGNYYDFNPPLPTAPGNQLPPQPSEVPMASANPFKGVLDDGTFQRAIASGKSVEDIQAELIRLGRLGKK